MLEPGQSKTWECPEGCDLTKQSCKHLDEIVNDPPSTSVRAVPVERIDSFYYESGAGVVVPPEVRDRIYEQAFRKKLKKHGLVGIKTEVLVLRFCYDATLKNIADELGIVSQSTVLRLINQSLRYLKSRGFK